MDKNKSKGPAMDEDKAELAPKPKAEPIKAEPPKGKPALEAKPIDPNKRAGDFGEGAKRFTCRAPGLPEQYIVAGCCEDAEACYRKANGLDVHSHVVVHVTELPD